jgi:predicted dehydrogenase
MKKNYRWGILGAGKIAEKFCTALCFTEGSEVYAVASRDADKANAYAAKFNATKAYGNYEGLMKDENVDIIYIATPHPFHHVQAIACMQNKKAVLCEKPLSLSYAQTMEMIETANQNKVFFMEGMWTASMPFIKKIRSLIHDDIIGTTKYVSADFGFLAPVDLEGRLYKKALGGGAMLDVGVYPLYLATLILGNPTCVKSVSKLSVTGIDEYTNMVLQYASGATAHLVCSINFNTAIEAEIIGTKGRIKIENPWFKATAFSLHLNDETIENFYFSHECNGFEHQIKEVMHCLDNGLLQSNYMRHELSLSLSKTSDEILRQAGVEY